MKPKQLLLTCLLVLVGSMAGQKAFAYNAKIGGIYYNFSGSEATVTYQKYDGSNYSSDYSGAIVIPKSVRYNNKTYSVTSVGNNAFTNCSDMTSITIPEGVKRIGTNAFSDCYALTSISLPETVQTIGEAAFWSCINATEINIPHLITKIEPNCFYHCMALTSVTIPEGVTSMGYQAFMHCNNLATLICLPPTAPKFGDNVIAYTAAKGVDIYVPAEGMTSYQNIGFKSDRRLHPMEVGSVLPSNKWSDAEYTVQTISYDSGVIYGNENESNPHYNKIVGVPDSDANGKNWYDIDYLYQWEKQTAPLNSWCQSGNYGDIYVRRAFYYDNDNKPEELYLACGHDDAPCEYYLNGELLFSKTDGWNDYSIHKLTEAQKVLLKPGQLNILAFHVHQNWGSMYADSGLYSSLEEMGISNKCGDNLFWTFDEETKTLTITGKGDMYDFENTNLVPWSVYSSEIKHICIQPGATSIGSRAFAYANWNITDIVIPEGITRIGRNAFSDCYALSSVSLPETVRTIGEAAFWSCISMTEVNIPKLVTKIEPNCFYHCMALKSITIPSNVTSIGNGAFQYCDNLKNVWCYAGAVPSTGSNLFYGSPITSATLHVPAASFIAYSTTVPWSSFGTIEPINGYVISDETTSFSIVAKESGKTVVLTHQFTGDWESLCLPFAIDYEAIRADFDLAEIDGIVQNDDNYDGIADITVLSIIGFKEQMTVPNKPYLIRAKNTGEQTIVFDDVTVYPTEEATFDCSSFSTKYEFTGSYNSLNASTLANRYVVQDGELVKGASALAPCRWYMSATARNGAPLNLPNRIRIMPVEDVITGSPSLTPDPSPRRGEIYNLAGQRLNKVQKGINIVNGKKVLIK